MDQIPLSTQRTARWICRLLAVGLLAVVAATTVVVGCRTQNSTPFLPSSSSTPLKDPPGERREALGEAGGAVPKGVTVFDNTVPGVANLDPDLLKALRQAAADAANEKVEFYVNSGWRSPAYQNKLLREAVSQYGSEEAAARWVATPATSSHVSGDAVDIGRSNATAWLVEHGAEYGLCQIYRNEPWHYELRLEAIDRGCPRMYADPTQDPRMQQ
ncbi:M15 family metallopeptidase [Actinomadura hibisca]|uniref:M15 family metallopeptidase n=1 Tax=Actinomadura hibisca TaxID=68565 RepID=UPI0008328AD2|nr:M15 family metallopeptidase [Actinomadura hibisca]